MNNGLFMFWFIITPSKSSIGWRRHDGDATCAWTIGKKSLNIYRRCAIDLGKLCSAQQWVGDLMYSFFFVWCCAYVRKISHYQYKLWNTNSPCTITILFSYRKSDSTIWQQYWKQTNKHASLGWQKYERSSFMNITT